MKNLLYVFADQWRAHAIGAAGQDPVATPHMDAFARESFQFTNAVSTYPLCSPHRASLLTGKYPYHCGMWTNCKPGLEETLMLKPQEVTIADVLHGQGYETAYIGKWHLDASEGNFFENPESGAIGWDAFTPPGERRHHFDYWYSYGAMDNHMTPHYWKDTPDRIKVNQWSVEHETDVALEYLKNRDAGKPFCMFLSWNPPHPPYDQLPEKYYQMYEEKVLAFRENVPEDWRKNPKFQEDMRKYFAAVSGVDENFGRLIAYLKENNLYEDTVLVLSSDHGDCMGSHGLYGKNVWYEESIRIPLYIGGMGIAPGISDSLISSQDHMPTLLELLDAPIPDTVEGVSLAPVLKGQQMEAEPQEVFLSMMPGMPDMVNEYLKLGLNSKCFGWRGLRTKTHTYVVDNGTKPGEERKRYLYDNVQDPYQLHPSCPSDQEAADWDKILIRYLNELRDPFLMPGREWK